MGKAFAPNVNKCHQKDICEKVEVENASDYGTAWSEQDYQPKKVVVPFPTENLSLDFADCDVGEVSVEDEAEIEFSHKDKSCEGAPELKFHDASSESIRENLWGDNFQSY